MKLEIELPPCNQGKADRHTVSYSVIQCHTVSYRVMQWQTMSYSVLQCHTVSYSVIQFPVACLFQILNVL